MDTLSLRTLAVAHSWVTAAVEAGDTVIDATAGNGYDTLFLAQRVGQGGAVHSFDIQEAAISQTKALLEKENQLSAVSLYPCCHSEIPSKVSTEISAAMFNLGYLPSSDKTVITEKGTTLAALNSCLELLKPQGIITIVCYPGHEGGEDEATAVDLWAKELNTPAYSVLKVTPHNPRSAAPYLIWIQKGR